MVFRFVVLVSLVLAGCAAAPVSSDAGEQASDSGDRDLDAARVDGSVPDAGSHDARDAGPSDGGRLSTFDAGSEPMVAIRPTPGELSLIQLDLPYPALGATGEAAIVIGPDGTLVLIDVGNADHTEQIRSAVRALNTTELTVARGYPSARQALQVEWVVITHLHSDHMGGLGALLTGADALQLANGVVYRGLTDLGGSISLDGKPPHKHYDAFCPVIRGPAQALNHPLCHTDTMPSCDSTAWAGQSFVATDCNGLMSGDLATVADDAVGAPAFISLGGGARLTILGVNGYAYDGSTLTAFSPAWGYSANDQENARSLVGLISHGAFRFVFAGDLSGSGSKDAPDLESFYVAHLASTWGALGVDVSHANHHARKTSSGPSYTASLAPKDGQLRNVLAGINEGYSGLPFTGVASPSKDALATWCDGNHLGGGNFWVTNVAPFGSSNAQLINAQANVVVQTIQQGLGYRIQTRGTPMTLKSFVSVRH